MGGDQDKISPPIDIKAGGKEAGNLLGRSYREVICAWSFRGTYSSEKGRAKETRLNKGLKENMQKGGDKESIKEIVFFDRQIGG